MVKFLISLFLTGCVNLPVHRLKDVERVDPREEIFFRLNGKTYWVLDGGRKAIVEDLKTGKRSKKRWGKKCYYETEYLKRN